MKRRRWLLVLGVLLVGAIGATAFIERGAIRLRWLRSKLSHATAADVKTEVHALDDGTIERLAFEDAVADEATRPYRQAALDELRARHPAELPALFVARTLGSALGLERRWVLELDWPVRDEVVDAASWCAIHDPDKWMSMRACEFVRFKGGARALPELRKAASTSIHEPTRLAAVGALVEQKDPGDVPVLLGALEDPSERVRITAAGCLVEQYHDDKGVQALVDALRGDHPERAADILARVREKRALGALAATYEERHVGRGALVEITGVELPVSEKWSDWVRAHAKELPPQLRSQH